MIQAVYLPDELLISVFQEPEYWEPALSQAPAEDPGSVGPDSWAGLAFPEC